MSVAGSKSNALMNDKIPVNVRLNLVIDISSRCLVFGMSSKLTRVEYEMGGQTNRYVHIEDCIDE